MSVRSGLVKVGIAAAGVGAYVGAGHLGETIGELRGESQQAAGQVLRVCADLAEYHPEAAELIYVAGEDGVTQVAVGIDIRESATAMEADCDPYSFAAAVQELPDEQRTSPGMIAFAAEVGMQDAREVKTGTKIEMQDVVKYGFGGLAAVWALHGAARKTRQAVANHRINKAERRAEKAERQAQREAAREARAARRAAAAGTAPTTPAATTGEIPVIPAAWAAPTVPIELHPLVDDDPTLGF